MSSNYIDGLMRECQQLQAEVERLKALQPCGHPNADIVSSDEGTQYCGRCAEIDRAVNEFARQRGVIDDMMWEVPDHGVQDDGSVVVQHTTRSGKGHVGRLRSDHD